MKHLIVSSLLIVFCNRLLAQSPTAEESIGMTISNPFYHNFRYYDYDSKANDTKNGIWGIGCSLFYKHHKVKYSLGATIITTGGTEIPILGGPAITNVTYVEGDFYYNIYNN